MLKHWRSQAGSGCTYLPSPESESTWGLGAQLIFIKSHHRDCINLIWAFNIFFRQSVTKLLSQPHLRAAKTMLILKASALGIQISFNSSRESLRRACLRKVFSRLQSWKSFLGITCGKFSISEYPETGEEDNNGKYQFHTSSFSSSSHHWPWKRSSVQMMSSMEWSVPLVHALSLILFLLLYLARRAKLFQDTLSASRSTNKISVKMVYRHDYNVKIICYRSCHI